MPALNGPHRMPVVWDGLVERGYSEDQVEKIMGRNLYRLYFEPRFERAITRWVTEARSRFDPNTGLLPHEVDHRTGQVIEGARGSSQSLMLRFLVEVDPAFARPQFRAITHR